MRSTACACSRSISSDQLVCPVSKHSTGSKFGPASRARSVDKGLTASPVALHVAVANFPWGCPPLVAESPLPSSKAVFGRSFFSSGDICSHGKEARTARARIHDFDIGRSAQSPNISNSELLVTIRGGRGTGERANSLCARPRQGSGVDRSAWHDVGQTR